MLLFVYSQCYLQHQDLVCRLTKYRFVQWQVVMEQMHDCTLCAIK